MSDQNYPAGVDGPDRPGPCPPDEELALLLDGLSDPETREALDAHAAACPACRAALVAAAEALAAADHPSTGREPSGARSAKPIRSWTRFAAAAAALALLASSAWLALAGRRGPAAKDAPETAAAAGIELADGFLATAGTGEPATLCVQSDGETLRWALVRGSMFVELDPGAPPVRLITPHATVLVEPGRTRVDVSPARTSVCVGSGRATVEGTVAKGAAPLLVAAGQVAEVAKAREPARRTARVDELRVPDWVRTAHARRIDEIASAALP